MSSHNIISFFLLTKFVTLISRFIFSSFPDQTRGYQKEPCIALNREPPNTPATPNVLRGVD
uniref:Uncharacterized protein n=1 Tax=Aegilops tauschii subsp. strangulata TaxID=200361 RepID=A0A452XHD9_AEGTS